MFADTELARRIDRAEASLSSDIAEATRQSKTEEGVFIRELGGGVAVFTGVASPITKVIGVGFGELPGDEELDVVERAFFERGSSIRAEVATLADPVFCARLTSRGYILRGFENVLGRAITDADSAGLERSDIEVVESAGAAEWNDVVITAFENPDTGVISAPAESFPREEVERILDDTALSRGFKRYLARVRGQAAGGASLRLFDGIAQLCGAGTHPRFRRQGVQTALLKTRLRDARLAGCEIAVITTQPGTKSQQNAHGRGFQLLYARAILVKDPPGRGLENGPKLTLP
jgi:ribosomal protein S18 acetylase RimI-like enzyme